MPTSQSSASEPWPPGGVQPGPRRPPTGDEASPEEPGTDLATNPATAGPPESIFTDNIPVGTYILQIEADGTPSFPFMSKRYLEMSDLTMEEVQADPTVTFTRAHPEDRDALMARNREAIEKGTPFYWEGRYVIRGEVKWGLIESFPRKLENGATIWEGACTDITRQKVAEERLRESERNQQKIIENLPIPLASGSLKDGGRVGFVNQVFLDTFGFGADDLPPLSEWLQGASPDPEAEGPWPALVARALQSEGRIPASDCRICCRNGSEKDVLVSGTLLDDQVLLSFVDLTERNRVQAALTRAREETMRQQMEDSKLNEKLRLVEDMHDGFGSQLTIAGMRVEAGEMSQADMATLLQDCLTDLHLVVDTLSEGDRSLQEALQDFQHRTTTRLADHPTRVSWDLRLSKTQVASERVILQVLRIVQEALSNALKHSGASEIRVSARPSTADGVLLEVRDDGRGLPSRLVRGRGLGNMETRAAQIGAELHLGPDPAGGTLVSLHLGSGKAPGPRVPRASRRPLDGAAAGGPEQDPATSRRDR